MLKVNSTRAKKILEAPQFYKREVTPAMRKFPGSGLSLWVEVEGDSLSVKNLSFSGALDPAHVLLIESMASLLIGKKLSAIEQFSVRELEAYLRDRNSEKSFEGLSPEIENQIQAVFRWIRAWPFKSAVDVYVYPREKGPFHQLKLIDKVREIKAFLASTEIASLYDGLRLPELIDVEDLTVYLDVPYADEDQRSLLHELHERGVEIFREEELNFIPERL